VKAWDRIEKADPLTNACDRLRVAIKAVNWALLGTQPIDCRSILVAWPFGTLRPFSYDVIVVDPPWTMALTEFNYFGAVWLREHS
jgi:hypothetical protein